MGGIDDRLQLGRKVPSASTCIAGARARCPISSTSRRLRTIDQRRWFAGGDRPPRRSGTGVIGVLAGAHAGRLAAPIVRPARLRPPAESARTFTRPRASRRVVAVGLHLDRVRRAHRRRSARAHAAGEVGDARPSLAVAGPGEKIAICDRASAAPRVTPGAARHAPAGSAATADGEERAQRQDRHGDVRQTAAARDHAGAARSGTSAAGAARRSRARPCGMS